MIEAICAKPMRWLGVLHARLRHIDEGSAISVHKMIAVALCCPVFQAHNLLFKVRYAAGVRRLRLLRSKQSLLGFQNETLQIDLDAIDRRLRLGSVQALHDVLRRLEAGKPGTDFC